MYSRYINSMACAHVDWVAWPGMAWDLCKHRNRRTYFYPGNKRQSTQSASSVAGVGATIIPQWTREGRKDGSSIVQDDKEEMYRLFEPRLANWDELRFVLMESLWKATLNNSREGWMCLINLLVFSSSSIHPDCGTFPTLRALNYFPGNWTDYVIIMVNQYIHGPPSAS